MQIKLIIFTLLFCSSAECSSPAATALRRRWQRPGHRPGHHDQVRATEATFSDSTSPKVTHHAKVLVAKPLTSGGDQCFALVVVTLTQSSPILTLGDHHSSLSVKLGTADGKGDACSVSLQQPGYEEQGARSAQARC
jgi:hypothetical protein